MPARRKVHGLIHHKSRIYGKSRNGQSLLVWTPDEYPVDILLLGAIHGDEGCTTILLSEALRTIVQKELRNAVILTANPDGLSRGTRCNAEGVDLNRNFPAGNWTPEPVYYRNQKGEAQDITLSPGKSPGSEPETQALISLIRDLQPRFIISMHGFLACIDDPDMTSLGGWISHQTGLPQIADIGYLTPGSFGSWAKEQQIPVITYELPEQSLSDLRKVHVPLLIDLLTGNIDTEYLTPVSK